MQTLKIKEDQSFLWINFAQDTTLIQELPKKPIKYSQCIVIWTRHYTYPLCEAMRECDSNTKCLAHRTGVSLREKYC